MTKKVFTISGLDCVSCTLKVDDALENLNGVKEAYTNYAKQKTEVLFDREKISEEQIKAIITKLGYTVIAP